MVALIGLCLLVLLWVLVLLLVLLLQEMLLLLLLLMVGCLLGLGRVVLRCCQRGIPQPAAMAGGACRGRSLRELPPGGQRVDVHMHGWLLRLLRAPLLLLLLLLLPLLLAGKAVQVSNAELGGQHPRQLLLLCLRVGRQLVLLLLLVGPARSGRCLLLLLLLLLLQGGLALIVQLWQAAEQVCSRSGLGGKQRDNRRWSRRAACQG
jgi:hypothetical protein